MVQHANHLVNEEGNEKATRVAWLSYVHVPGSFITRIELIILFLFCLLTFSTSTVLASVAPWQEQNIFISATGTISGTLDAFNCSGNSPTFYGYGLFSGTYPTATSTPVKITPANYICPAIEGLNLDSWYGGAGVPDGTYMFATTFAGSAYSPSWELTDTVVYTYYTKASTTWYSAWGTTTIATSTCDTCTRIISFNPSQSEVVPEVTDSKYWSIRLYLAEEDYDVGNTYARVEVSKTSDQVDYLFDIASGTRHYQSYEDLNLLSGENLVSGIWRTLTDEGVYHMRISIYQNSWLSWLPFVDDTEKSIYTEGVYFFVGTSTASASDLPPYLKGTGGIFNGDEFTGLVEDTYGKITCDDLFTSAAGFLKCAMKYVWHTILPDKEVMLDDLKQSYNQFIAYYPWGYAPKIWNILQSAQEATTTALAITLTGATGTPMAGLSLTLDAGQGLTDSIEYLDETRVATIDGSPFAMFMQYWELMWYIVLGLWMLKEIFNIVGVDFTRPRQTIYDNQLRDAREGRQSRTWYDNTTITADKTYHSYHNSRRLKK